MSSFVDMSLVLQLASIVAHVLLSTVNVASTIQQISWDQHKPRTLEPNGPTIFFSLNGLSLIVLSFFIFLTQAVQGMKLCKFRISLQRHLYLNTDSLSTKETYLAANQLSTFSPLDLNTFSLQGQL